MPSRTEPSSPPKSTEGLLAAGPKRIVWQVANIASKDGHSLTAHFSATATIAASVADAAMIRETFSSEPAALTVEAVRDYFRGPVEGELFNKLNQRAAAEFDAAEQVDLVRESVVQALRMVGFSAGVRFVEPFSLTIHSPTRQRQLLETAARLRAAEALAQATNTMQQFQKLRSEQPDASMGRVLNQIGADASETLLPTLLKGWAEQRTASQIIVASGEQVIAFSLSGDGWISKPIAIPNLIGALRTALPLPVRGERVGERASALGPSMRPLSSTSPMPSPPPSPRLQGEGGSILPVSIALGGQRGVLLIDGDQSTHFALPADRVSQLGVNSIAVGSSQLLATHSEFGLFVWSLADPASPQLHAYSQAKFATMLDETSCVFVANEQLFVAFPRNIRPLTKPTGAAVIAMVPDDAALRIIFADGTIARLNAREPEPQFESKLGETIAQATTIDWLGESRLLIANDRGEIEVVGDNSRTRFLHNHAGWRKLVAAADLIAALSLDRTRVVLWRPWQPNQPVGELHVASVTGHRASDLTLLPTDDLSA